MPKSKPEKFRLRTPAPIEKRSSDQAAATRQLIIDAFLECAGEMGFQKASAAEVTKRSGMTWGAVVYYFGDKHGLLIAAVEYGMGTLLASLQELSADKMPLAERIDKFVDQCFGSLGAAGQQRAILEILLGYISRGASDWYDQMFNAWQSEWMRIFGDVRITAREHRELAFYTISALVGLIYTRSLGHKENDGLERSIDILKDTIQLEFTAKRKR